MQNLMEREPVRRQNVVRDTPGRLLLAWAMLFSSLVLLSHDVTQRREEFDWIEFPTALGDTATLLEMEWQGDQDLSSGSPMIAFDWQGEPSLGKVLVGHEVSRDDARMRKVALENSARLYLYQEEPLAGDGSATCYVKYAEGRYTPVHRLPASGLSVPATATTTEAAAPLSDE